jgi:hypothetical protein
MPLPVENLDELEDVENLDALDNSVENLDALNSVENLDELPEPEAPSGVGAFLGRAANATNNALIRTVNRGAEFVTRGNTDLLKPFNPLGSALEPTKPIIDEIEKPQDDLGGVAGTAADIVGNVIGETPSILLGGAATKGAQLIPKVGKVLRPMLQFGGAGALSQEEGNTLHGVTVNAGMGGAAGVVAPLVRGIQNPVVSNVAERLAAGTAFGGVQTGADLIRDGEVNWTNTGTAAAVGTVFHSPTKKGKVAKPDAEPIENLDALDEPTLTAKVLPNEDQVAPAPPPLGLNEMLGKKSVAPEKPTAPATQQIGIAKQPKEGMTSADYMAANPELAKQINRRADDPTIRHQGRALHEMTPDEIYSLRSSLETDEQSAINEVFGSRADEYRKLARKANGINDEQDMLEAWEQSLSPEQKKRFAPYATTNLGDSLDANPASRDNIAWFERAIGQLDIESPEALGSSLKRALIDLGGHGTAPEKMNIQEQSAYAAIREAMRIVEDNGWDSAKVTAAAFDAVSRELRDPFDVEFILRQFKKGASGAQQVASDQVATPANALESVGDPSSGAGASAPKPADSLLPPEAGKFKLETLTPAGQVETVAQANFMKPDELLAQRRATTLDKNGNMVRPIAQTFEDAKTANVPLEGKVGDAYNAEQQVRLKQQTNEYSKRVVELKAKYDASPDPDLGEELNHATRDAFAAVKTMLGAKTEAGRALRVLRETVGLPGEDYKPGSPITPDLRTAAMERITKLYGDTPVPAEVQKRMFDIPDDKPDELVDLLHTQFRAKTKTPWEDAAINTYKAGLLTGVKTIMRNLGGNSLKGAALEYEKATGSIVDWMVGLRTKQRTKLSPFGTNVLDDLSNAYKDTKAEVKQTWQTGAPTPDMLDAIRGMGFNKQQNTNIPILDAYVNTVFKVQALQDIPFRKFQLHRSMQEDAKAQALTEAKQGVISKESVAARTQELMAAPTTEMQLTAAARAADATFSGRNPWAEFIDKADKHLRSGTGVKGTVGKVASIALNTKMPFKGTPFNIVKDVSKYALIDPVRAPAYAAMKIPKIVRNTLTKEEQRALADYAGRASVGGSLIAAGVLMAAKHYATGSSKKEGSGEKGMNEVVGRQGSAVKAMGNWLSTAGTAPIPQLITFGATVFDVLTRPMENPNKRLGTLGAEVARIPLDNPFFQGIEDLSKMEQPGGISRAIGTSAAGFVPTFINDIGALSDTYRRDARPKPEDGVLSSIGKQVMSRVPGLRQSLPIRRDALGKPMLERTQNAVNPTFPSPAREDTDPFMGELVRLRVSMPTVEKKLGESPKQFEQRQVQGGQMAEETMRSVFNSPDYQQLDDTQKKALLERLLKNARSTAGTITTNLTF